MVRAVRMQARFGFTMDPPTREAIKNQAQALLPAVAKERIWQEFHKMASYPGFTHGLLAMQELGLLSQIFPQLTEVSLGTLQQRLESVMSPVRPSLGWYRFFPT